MTIMGSNSLFVLIKVKSEKNTDEIKLEVSSSNFFSKEFNPADFKKNELTLIGVADQENLIFKLNNYLNCYIEIEKLENGKLDFWSEDIHIGTFEIKQFEEKTTDFSKTDWIESYQYLLTQYIEKEQVYSKESRLTNKFIIKLESFIEQERNKNAQKIEFFKTDLNKVTSIKEKTDLIDKFENMKEQYLNELRKI